MPGSSTAGGVVRRDYTWFEKRASTIWSAEPGRSFLLVVPHGCNETETARAVATWTSNNFRLPPSCRNHRPTVVRIMPDAVPSTAQFVRKFGREVAKQAQGDFEIQEGDYPTETLEILVEEAHDKGMYPIFVIERFHSFAELPMTTFSRCYQPCELVEHAKMVTTLAISPIGYDTMRRRMASDLPFVNSAYGDNHDRAIMKPLTREDFVEAAVSRGLNSSVANKLYAIGGGPDVIYQTLIDVATEGHSDLVEQCARRLDQCLVQFLDYTLAEPGYDWDDILGRLALGALRPIEQDYVSGHLLSEFLIKRTAQCRIHLLKRHSKQGYTPNWKAYLASV